MTASDDALERAVRAARSSYGRLVAVLSGATHDLAAVEDALADAFERALTTWPNDGIPRNQDAWLLTVARNRLRDQWRSAESRTIKSDDLITIAGSQLDPDTDAVPDRRLELMLACAHPAIAPDARAPLMLNTVLGFTAAQIADALAIPAATMSTRLTRAKRRIKENRIPFEIPARDDLSLRVESVCEAIYGAFAIDWQMGETGEMAVEAAQLAEILASLLPQDAEVRGLAALILLTVARRPARLRNGELVPIGEQDVSLWNRELIGSAHEHLRAAHRQGEVGRFQLEAAIQAVHCSRAEGATPDPETLLGLHRSNYAIAPSLGSAAALAVVLGDHGEGEEALVLLDSQGERAESFQPAWVARSHVLAKLGRTAQAREAHDRALALSNDERERRLLGRTRP